MIDTMELRRGNLIVVEGQIEAVIDVLCDSVSTHTKHCMPLEFCDPIVLTPEILEKCGWVLDFTDKKTGIKSFLNYNLDLDAINICLDGSIYYNCWEKSKAPEYLHQVQNVYYYLKKTELIINL